MSNTTPHMLVRFDGRVLSRMATNPTFWGDPQLAECVNYRYAVKFPSARSARAAAGMHGGIPKPMESIK